MHIRTKIIVFSLIAVVITIALVAWNMVKERKTHNHDYPREWSPLINKWFGCPDLSGAYRFAGDFQVIEKQAKGSGVPLAGFIGEPQMYRLIDVKVHIGQTDWKAAGKKITHVSVRGPYQDNLQVTYWHEETKLFNALLKYQKDFSCHLGMLEIHRTGETGSISQSRSEIQKSNDGSLVSKTSNTTFGLLVFFPYKESSVVWYRWLPYEQPNSALQGTLRNEAAQRP